MIRFGDGVSSLAPRERHGFDILVDLARLVPVERTIAPDAVTSVDVHRGPTTPAQIEAGDFRTAFAVEDGSVRVDEALLRWIVETSSARAEQESSARDRYGRVPTSENAGVRAKSERSAPIHAAASAFRGSVLAASGARDVRLVPAWPDRKSWAVAWTHDLDGVSAWPLFSGLRLIESAKRRSFGLLRRVAAGALRSIGRDPLGDGARELLSFLASRRLATTWFVLCGTPTWRTLLRGDLTYVPEGKPARRLIEAIASEHEVALHGSFETSVRHELFEAQKNRLETLIGRSVVGNRQHFLRMRPGKTERGMARAGFVYDSSYGFPDRSGFRIGCADVVSSWDFERDVPNGLVEIPFVWMDRSMSKYQGIEDPRQWIRDGAEIANEVRASEGCFVAVWHPHLTDDLGYPDAFLNFQSFVTEIMSMDPYSATLESIVAWRALRRSIRILEHAPGRPVEANARASFPGSVRLVDRGGEAKEAVRILG